jgi:cellulose synthase/poly-beta-1,6-N-acetylglucosamine synthase-like glycosyltransferase
VAGGKDGTLEKALSLQSSVRCLRVVEQLPGNKNAALLSAYKHIDPAAEVIGIVDADTLVAKNWLTEMVTCLRRGDYAAVQAIYRPANPSWISHYYMFLQYKYQASNKPTLVGRGSALLRRDVIEKVGPERAFDPNIKIGEDYHLRLLLQDAGGALGYCEQARVETWLPASLATFVRLESMWVRGWTRQSRHTVRLAAHYLLDSARVGSLLLALLAMGAQRPVVAAVVGIPAALFLLVLCFDILKLAVKGRHGQLLVALPQVIALNLVHLFVRFIAMNRVLAFDDPREVFQQGERPASV